MAFAARRARRTIVAMKNLARLVVASLGLFLFAGCASQKTSAPATSLLKTTCVVSGEAVDASSPTADYMGGKVGFCCEKCLAKWNGMDDAGRKAAFDARK